MGNKNYLIYRACIDIEGILTINILCFLLCFLPIVQLYVFCLFDCIPRRVVHDW